MYKACSRCGKIHDTKYRCNAGRTYSNNRSDAEKLRYTTGWRKKAQQIKEESNFLCAVCLDNGVFNYNDLEVHHIEKLNEAPAKAFEDSNLICLCRTHHKAADSGVIDARFLRKLTRNRIEDK